MDLIGRAMDDMGRGWFIFVAQEQFSKWVEAEVL